MILSDFLHICVAVCVCVCVRERMCVISFILIGIDIALSEMFLWLDYKIDEDAATEWFFVKMYNMSPFNHSSYIVI